MKEAAGGAKIIIMGDFNCTPDDEVMRSLVAPSESASLLVNLSEKQAEEWYWNIPIQGNVGDD